jgi:hypothetical protein
VAMTPYERAVLCKYLVLHGSNIARKLVEKIVITKRMNSLQTLLRISSVNGSIDYFSNTYLCGLSLST